MRSQPRLCDQPNILTLVNCLQVYDCALEATALRQAKKCVYEHSKIRPGFGENIFANSWLNLDKIEVAKQVVFFFVFFSRF